MQQAYDFACRIENVATPEQNLFLDTAILNLKWEIEMAKGNVKEQELNLDTQSKPQSKFDRAISNIEKKHNALYGDKSKTTNKEHTKTVQVK